MYITALVGSISAFVCSFIPLIGIPFTLVFSITAIVFSILVFVKFNEKERKDASIIALIISIVAIINCVYLNFVTIKSIINRSNAIDDSINYDYYYKQKFENYEEYDIDDEIIIGDSFILRINDFLVDGDTYYAEIEVESLNDGEYFSIYDFGIYNIEEDNVIYSSYSSNLTNYVSSVLNEGETKDVTLKFDSYFKNDSKLYLLYIDDENGVKIKL